jgi:hypothetical protein
VQSVYDAHSRTVLLPVVTPDSDYLNGLENCSPLLLRTFPHFAMKQVTGLELTAISQVLLRQEFPPARFVDLLENEGSLDAISAEALPLLANAEPQQLADVAEEWFHESNGGCVSVADSLWVLERIAKLAQIAVQARANLFSHFNV